MRRFPLSLERCPVRADSRPALAVALLLLVPSCGEPEPSQQPVSATPDSGFSSSDCMERHFPAARTMTPPPEVRFYCAAPWNQATFAKLAETLASSGVDVAGIAIRATAPENRATMEQVAPLALEQADQGPPGMGALYRAFKVLPFLGAIRNGTDSDALARLDPQDVAALRAAAAAIDWNAPALEPGSADQPETGLSPNAGLAAVPEVVLRIAA